MVKGNIHLKHQESLDEPNCDQKKEQILMKMKIKIFIHPPKKTPNARMDGIKIVTYETFFHSLEFAS